PSHPSTFLQAYRALRDPPSFPTRRSSDLQDEVTACRERVDGVLAAHAAAQEAARAILHNDHGVEAPGLVAARPDQMCKALVAVRSEEHTSELQSRENLVCRLLLEKKK